MNPLLTGNDLIQRGLYALQAVDELLKVGKPVEQLDIDLLKHGINSVLLGHWDNTYGTKRDVDTRS